MFYCVLYERYYITSESIFFPDVSTSRRPATAAIATAAAAVASILRLSNDRFSGMLFLTIHQGIKY